MDKKEEFLIDMAEKIKEISDLIDKHDVSDVVIGSIVVGVLVKNDSAPDYNNLKVVYSHLVDNIDELEAINEFSESAFSADQNTDGMNPKDWFSQN